MLVGRSRDSGVAEKVEHIIAEDDRVAVRWTFTGVYRGEETPGCPRPGERITFGSMSFYRFANGKIEEDWGPDVVSSFDDPWSWTGQMPHCN